MLKILLVCAGGMSTGFMIKKIEQAALKKNIEIDIKAVGVPEVSNVWEKYDYILVAPQVRFSYDAIIAKTDGSKKTSLIEPSIYGSMDGEKILELVIKLGG